MKLVKPAIVLGTHTMGLGVIRALGSMGIPIIAIYYDSKDMGYVSRYVKESVRAPDPEKFADQFLELVILTASRFDSSLVFPVSDETMELVSRNKNVLDEYCTTACTEWKITHQFINKKYTYALADAIGVPAPITIVPKSLEDVEKYGQTIEYPCLVKPTLSHYYYKKFNKKMVRVNNIDQMIGAYRQASDVGLEVMLQEIIPGDDALGVNYNSYFWKNQPLVEFTAQQVRNAPPIFGSPCVAVSKNIPEVIEPGRKILRAMGFYGYSCTEFKKDPRDGVYKLMEVNGRHNLSTLLAVECGINFPWIHYTHLVEGELPSVNDFRENVFWIDIIRDIAYGGSYMKSKGSLFQFVHPYLGSHVFAIIDFKDLKPFIQRCFYLVKRALNNAFNVFGNIGL